MPQLAGFMGRSAEGGIKASSAGRAETSLAVAEQVKSASLAAEPRPVVVSSPCAASIAPPVSMPSAPPHPPRRQLRTRRPPAPAPAVHPHPQYPLEPPPHALPQRARRIVLVAIVGPIASLGRGSEPPPLVSVLLQGAAGSPRTSSGGAGETGRAVTSSLGGPMQRKAPRPASPGGRLRVRWARSDEVRRLPDASPFTLYTLLTFFPAIADEHCTPGFAPYF